MNLKLHSKQAKLIVAILLFVTSFVANAQKQTVVLTGKVVDENQQPLVGATINVKESRKVTATDVDGKFKLNVFSGKYVLEISYVGYKTLEKEIVAGTKNLVFVLSASQNVLDEVLVSAVRVKADAPVTHSNLTKEEIAKRNLGQDIPVLLKYLPSVTTSSDAGAGVGYTYIRVRGSDGSRVNVTVNGIPYNDAESQGTFWVNMGDFASSTESLQLQRGVGTSTNGSGAFGASLNILTDAVAEEAGGEISNSFGSYGTRKHTVKFSTGKLNDHFELAGRVSNIYSDGYVDRASTDLKSYFLQASYVDENTLVKALAFGGKEKTYQAWYGLTASQLEEDRRQNPYTYDNETDNYQQDHYQLHWSEKFNENWSTNVGLNYTKGAGYFEQYKEAPELFINEDLEEPLEGEELEAAIEENENDIVNFVESFNNLTERENDVIVRRWLDNDFYVANVNVTYKNDMLEVIGGGSYSNYTSDHFGEVIWGSNLTEGTQIRDQYYFSDAKKTDISTFLKATYKVTDKLTVFGDIQGRFVSYQTAGLTSDRDVIDVDADFNFFNPKLGLTYKVNDNNSLYASYAKANREPNRSDFEVGTTQHESLDDYELGWRLDNKVVKLNTNVYFMNYKNQLVLTGAINDVGEAIRATSGKSYRLGLEVDADIRLNKTLSLRSNLAISRSRNKDFNTQIFGGVVNLGDTPISNSPDFIASNILVYQPVNNLQISLLSKYIGEQYMGNFGGAISSLEKLDDYATVDFNIVYEVKMNKIFKSIVFTGMVNNLFNKEYVDRGYYGVYNYEGEEGEVIAGDWSGYYPQATRNFLLGATLKF